MRAITEIAEVAAGRVVYHSAFGFAQVTAVHPNGAILAWDPPGESLPDRAAFDVLRRVYALCKVEGFFEQSVLNRKGLEATLQADGLKALAMLLEELEGPQSQQAIREWVVGRQLMPPSSFTHWWTALLPVIQTDARFQSVAGGWTISHDAPTDGPEQRLADPLLTPGQRLDLTLQHRQTLSPQVYLDQVLTAWRLGGTQVKDLAQTALRSHAPQQIIDGLLRHKRSAIDAIIHGIRRSGWAPEAITEDTHLRLIDLFLAGCDEGGPLDREGRLAAALTRWPSPGTIDALSEVASSASGKRLLRATFAALPPRRAEALAIELVKLALDHHESHTAQWLGGELLGFALVDQDTMADRLDDDHPELADWFRENYRGVDGKPSLPEYEDTMDEPPQTAEIDLSDLVTTPIPLGKLPPRSGASLLGLGLGMARALSQHHKEGRIANPTAFSVKVLPDETMLIDTEDEGSACPRPMLEDPSPAADVYAAGVLLLESLLGRPWPRNIPASRAIPYLRMAIPLLPPSAIAPLDVALHPDPTKRPADGLAWLALWQTAAVAEENRAYTPHDPMARLRIGYDTHIGRMKALLTQTNQDALFFSSRGPLSFLVVCDGISTANAGSGDIASSIASHVMANLWEQALPRLLDAGPGEIREFIDRALRMANAAICEAALRFAGGNLEGRVPMGTTCVCAVVYGNIVNLAWLGDSRAYLVGPYGASLLTADENQAAERLKAWHLNFVERWDPAGFALIGYLGHFNELIEPEALLPQHTTFTLVPGERLVMMSDGVTDYIGETHPEVAMVIRDHTKGPDCDEVARTLVNLANRGGGGDNITCMISTLH